MFFRYHPFIYKDWKRKIILEDYKPYVRRLCRCGVLIPIGIMLTGKHRAAF